MILEDEERLGQIQEVVGKRRNASRTESVTEDLGKPENSMKFSEESSRTNHELDNIQLHELGTDIQNRAVPFLLEAHTAGIDLLLFVAFDFDLMKKQDSRL